MQLVTVKLCASGLDDHTSRQPNGRQLDFEGRIQASHGEEGASIMTDTGSSASSFVNTKTVKRLKLSTVALAKPIKLRLANDKLAPNITHMAQVKFSLGRHVTEAWSLITDLGRFDLVLGMPWMEQHDVQIGAKARSITFGGDYCMEHCIHDYRPTTVYSVGNKPNVRHQRRRTEYEEDIAAMSATAFMKMATQEKNQVIAMWPAHFEALNKPESEDVYLCANSITMDVAAVTAEDYEKFFNKAKRKPVGLKELKRRVPAEFHEYLSTFDPKEANKLPPHRGHDHKIELQPGARPPAKRAYGLSRQQALVVKKYTDDMLGKGFIRPSSSEYAAPVLIVKKPEGGLRVCVDYRALNAITVKNRNAPPLIRETLAQLCRAKIYSKFDIIAAFNEVRMRKGDEHKTAFLTRYGLFEYVVMPFGLCNAPGTFQAFINDTLREYLDDFCTSYLDDILIYSDNKKDHIAHVSKVLERLRRAGLFLDIDKSEFFVTSVKYLGLIITTDGVRMDPKKIEAILNWKSPKNIRDVQAFLGFANFYRKFILGYSRIIAPLTKLTRNEEKDFMYPWNPDGSEERAFRALKLAFTKGPILQHFNPDLETWIETDASDYVVAAVLSQIGPDEKLHPVAYMSKKMSPAECNYEIYDKELLAIVRAFEEWRPECAGTPVESPIKILTDHKNLEHFMTSKQLNRRQARWAEFLSEFNFRIAYRPGAQGTKPDSLTRRSEGLPENKDDERHKYNHRILLKDHHLDKGVRNAIRLAPMLMDESEENAATLAAMIYELSEEGLFAGEELIEESPAEDILGDPPPGEESFEESPEEDATSQPDFMERIKAAYPNDAILQRIMQSKRDGHRRVPKDITKTGVRLELSDCTTTNDMFYVKGRLYVPDDEQLQTAILEQIHESPPGGHAGRATTYDRTSSHYYWPRMTATVARYVKGCHQCKRTKHFREGKQGLLKPLPIPDRYFTDISVDFITPLPICERNGRRYQHIMVVVDRLSKKKRFIALDSLEVKAVVQAFIEWIWREEGYPMSIVSDRGSQFISHFWRRLCKRIGTHPKLSTAWHSETDGQTEIANADLKAYLRAYVNFNQDNWVDQLPIAEFEANSAKSSSTGIEPFLATKGYLPRSGLELPEPLEGTPTQKREMKDADKLIEKLEEIRLYLREELKWAQALMEEQANQRRHPAPEFRVGDKVMLDARYLRTLRPNKGLDYKNLGPFKISKIINRFACRLELPESMQGVFPVFHPWLLHLDDSNPMPGQADSEPDPVATDERGDEYSVDEILNSRIDKRKNDPATNQKGCLRYQIKWTGYENVNTRPEWYDYTEVANASDLVADFHHKYPEKPGPHASFVRPTDWEPLEE